MSAPQQMLLASGPGYTYATWNPSNKGTNVTLSNGNLTASTIASNEGVTSTIGKASGKWYWEISGFIGATSMVGIATSSYNVNTSTYTSAACDVYYGNDGNKYIAGVVSAYGATYGVGSVLGIALDMDAGTLVIYKNNVSQGTMASGLSGTWYAVAGEGAGNGTQVANFGATAFTYTPPAGFNSGLYS